MPNAIIKKLAEESGIEESKLESIWLSAANHGKNKGLSKDKYEAYANAAVHHAASGKLKGMDSNRYIDANGCLICPGSIITGADVARYWGREIPGYKELGLIPDKAYWLYRPIEEMRDNDFNGKYIFDHHIIDYDAANMDKVRDHIIGTAYDCLQVDSEIHGTTSFTDVKAIDDIDNGKKYLSAGYWYTPIIKSGTFNGQQYDIMMTDIKANHIALVDNPRYKSAVVGDEDAVNSNVKKGTFTMKYKNRALNALMTRLGTIKGLDEETVKSLEEEAKAADEEEAKKKAEDEEAEAKKKAEDEEAKKKAEDEHSDEKADEKLIEKTLKEKGLDADSFNRRVSEATKASMDEFKAQQKAMDTAFDAFERLYGKPNKMAFDSPDAIYDAILTRHGANAKGRSLEAKIAMVEMIGSTTKPVAKKSGMAADADSGAGYKSVFESLDVLKRFNK